jgi:hypothetical protein
VERVPKGRERSGERAGERGFTKKCTKLDRERYKEFWKDNRLMNYFVQLILFFLFLFPQKVD